MRLPVHRGAFRLPISARRPTVAALQHHGSDAMADYGLKGHVAIVTGSTSGIRQARAPALAAEGVNIVLNGFGDAAAIEKDRAALAASAGVEVRYHGADMTKP